jgi:hypothetical protein
MSETRSVFELLNIAVKQGSHTLLKEALDSFPYDVMEENELDELFSQLLTLAATAAQNKTTIRFLVEYWDNLRNVIGGADFNFDQKTQGYRVSTLNAEEDVLPVVAYVFMLPQIIPDVLKMVISSIPNTNAVELLEIYGKSHRYSQNAYAMSRIIETFGNTLSYQTVLDLYQNVILNKNNQSEEFLALKLEEISPFVERPSWVHNFTDIDPPPRFIDYEDELKELDVKIDISQLDPDSLIDMLTSGLADVGVALDEIESNKRKLKKRFEKSSVAVREQMLMPIIESEKRKGMRESEDLFHLFGPSFASSGTDFSLNTPCTQWGGCRMFLCVCHERSDDDGEYVDVMDENDNNDSWEVEWFRGACDNCHRRIERKHYAVRIPVSVGGWKGCFCSWDCVKLRIGLDEKMRNKYNDDETDDEIELEGDPEEVRDELIEQELAKEDKEIYETETVLDQPFVPLETCDIKPKVGEFTFDADLIVNRKERDEGRKEEQGKKMVSKMIEDPKNQIDIGSLLLAEEFENSISTIGIQELSV